MNYKIELIQTASHIVEVNARSQKEAEEKAIKKAVKDNLFGDSYHDCIRAVVGQKFTEKNSELYTLVFNTRK